MVLTFLKDVIGELKKLYIPTKKETYITVITIVISIIVSAVIVMFTDFVISTIIKALFNL